MLHNKFSVIISKEYTEKKFSKPFVEILLKTTLHISTWGTPLGGGGGEYSLLSRFLYSHKKEKKKEKRRKMKKRRHFGAILRKTFRNLEKKRSFFEKTFENREKKKFFQKTFSKHFSKSFQKIISFFYKATKIRWKEEKRRIHFGAILRKPLEI